MRCSVHYLSLLSESDNVQMHSFVLFTEMDPLTAFRNNAMLGTETIGPEE